MPPNKAVTQNQPQRDFSQVKRVVIKIGSSLLTNEGKGLDKVAIAGWAAQIAAMYHQEIELLLVSSGAVAEGMVRMNLAERPKHLPPLQACAAIGQMGLVETWATALAQHHIKTAQVLLTHDDLSHRQRYLNIGDTLTQLLDWQVIPVINENDTVAVDEIKFGDNDTLGAMAAALIHADLYIILTDQQGVFTDNPRHNPDAKLISSESAMADYLFDIAGDGGKLGRGGMLTKVRAARLAAMGGCPTIIASGQQNQIIARLLAGEAVGTLLTTTTNNRVIARKQWLAAHLQTAGRLVLDAGAVAAIANNNRSLLPVGVKAVIGDFAEGDVVECVDELGVRVAVGRVNCSASDAKAMIAQRKTTVNTTSKPSQHRIVMIHRDYMAIA